MAMTGTELISRVRQQADVENNLARHPDALVLGWINQSIAAYRRLLSRIDLANYGSFTTISTVSNVSTVSLPACEEVLGMQVTLNNVTNTLHRAQSNEQTQYRIPGRPAMWALRDSVTAGVMNVVLYPTPDAVYTISVEYLPAPTTVTAGMTWYPEVSGGEEWVIFDVATKIAVRDNNAQRAQMLASERDRQEDRLKDMAMRGREPGRRVDTRGQSRVNDMQARRRA